MLGDKLLVFKKRSVLTVWMYGLVQVENWLIVISSVVSYPSAVFTSSEETSPYS